MVRERQRETQRGRYREKGREREIEGKKAVRGHGELLWIERLGRKWKR